MVSFGIVSESVHTLRQVCSPCAVDVVKAQEAFSGLVRVVSATQSIYLLGLGGVPVSGRLLYVLTASQMVSKLLYYARPLIFLKLALEVRLCSGIRRTAH